MDTAICFANDTIQLIRGRARGGRVQLRGYERVRLPEGVMINGIITDEEKLKATLKELRDAKKLRGKVHISVDSSDILAKVSEVPLLKPSQLRDAVRREFDNLDSQYGEQVFDYTVLDEVAGGDKRGRILCCAASKSMMTTYDTAFRGIGIKPVSFDMGLNCILKCATMLPDFHTSRFVLCEVEGNRMACYLFSDGQYLFSNRAWVNASAESEEEYVSEILGRISSIHQFYKSEKGDVSLQRAYFSGVPLPVIAQCRAAGFLNLQFDPVPECPRLQTKGAKEEEPFALANYLEAVGCLIRK